MTVKIGDTLYGVHERFFYVPGEAAPRKLYKMTQETVTNVFSDGNFQTEYYMDGFKRIGHYRTRDIGKTVFFGRGAAGIKRQELSVSRRTDETEE